MSRSPLKVTGFELRSSLAVFSEEIALVNDGCSSERDTADTVEQVNMRTRRESCQRFVSDHSASMLTVSRPKRL